MIKLTTTQKIKVYINPSMIISIILLETYRRVSTCGTDSVRENNAIVPLFFDVLESEEEIIKLIKGEI